jgi:signal transduction histidine kinase/HAMP domain-containing protein/ActR/RegA family two-component response regulator
MSDKDLRSQIEGSLSDIIAEPEADNRDKSLLEKAIFGSVEAKSAEVKLTVPGTPSVTRMELDQITKEIPLGTVEKQGVSPMPVSPARRTPHLVRRSIRTRLLILLLGLTTISVLAVAYLGVNSVQRVGHSAQQTSGEALRAQAEEYLRQLTVGDAQRNDLILKRVQRDAENVAQYAAGIFEKPDVFARGAYWQAEDHMFMGPDGQYINGEEDACSVFVPDFVDINDELLTALELGAYLDFIFPPTYESDPNTVAIYLGTEQETTRYYPNIGLGTILPADFQVTQRPWYTSSTLENNPERKAVWSPVYEDATGKGFMVTAAAPVYTSQDEFVGVVGIDFTLKDISANVEAARLLGSGYSFLVDDTGRAIALPEQGYQDILGRVPEPSEFGVDLSEVTTEFAPILAKMMAGSTGFDTLEVGGKELFVAYAPLESTGWSLASVVETEEVLQAVVALREELGTSTRSLLLARILPVGGGILAVMAAIGLLLTNRLVEPIQKLAAAAQRIGAGQWDAPLPRTGNDEIGVLSQAFATMTVQLRELMESLEQRVADRTRELERRAVQLLTAAEVSHATSSILDPDELLSRTVELIADRFNLYYAGLFLVDEVGEWAVLRAGTGEAGQQMMVQGHRLKVGGVSMVGWCTANAQARIALDVGEEAVRFDNPLLPDTRSEMALPLISRGRVIGALDVQSIEEAAFTDEDVAVLQSMADQLANAIENTRLFRQTQKSLEEISRLQQRYLQEEWQKYLADEEARARAGYLYDRGAVRPVGEVWMPEIALAAQRAETVALSEIATALQESMDAVGASLQQVHPERSRRVQDTPLQTAPAQSALAVPLKLRGQVIGALDFYETEQPRQWSSDDIALVEAVADQVALAVENARAYAELQRTAGQLKEMDRLKTQFLANMSHELRTPLNSIIGFSRVILKGIDGPITEQQREDLTSIYNNGQHLLGLINDILDISRIEAGKMELIFEPLDLQHVINGVMSTAIGLVKDKPIKLEREVAPDLPTIRADGTRLRQVILNLLSNAAKFTERGQITLRAYADEENVTISVSDTGIGISAEHQAILFQEFSQVDASSTRRTGGAGLGLAISRHLVELHGGRIGVESEPGVGSTFTVTLPVAGPKAKQAEELEALADLMISPDRKLILAVEDDGGVIVLYKRYLEKHGYQIVGLGEGGQAVRWARELSPYAIILDVLLPDKDGWEVLEELKNSRETRQIPLIVCTTVSDGEARGLSMGADYYLVKPILEEDLLQSLERLEERQRV